MSSKQDLDWVNCESQLETSLLDGHAAWGLADWFLDSCVLMGLLLQNFHELNIVPHRAGSCFID